MAAKVFISYRRADSAGYAGRVLDPGFSRVTVTTPALYPAQKTGALTSCFKGQSTELSSVQAALNTGGICPNLLRLQQSFGRGSIPLDIHAARQGQCVVTPSRLRFERTSSAHMRLSLRGL